MNEIIEKCIKQLNSIDLQAAIEVGHGNRFDFLLTLNSQFPLIGVDQEHRRDDAIVALDVDRPTIPVLRWSASRLSGSFLML